MEEEQTEKKPEIILPALSGDTIGSGSDIISPPPGDDVPDRMDLFRSMVHMAYVSELIYDYTTIRKLAREGKIDQKWLDLPVTLADVQQMARENEDLLRNELGHKEFDLLIGELVNISSGEQNTSAADVVESAHEESCNSVVLEMGDADNFTATYHIGINHAAKMVLVAFKGTSSMKDMVADMIIHMKEIPNPVVATTGKYNTIKVHAGFYDYLFASPPPLADTPEIRPPSKFDFILNQTIEILRANPGYTMMVTGHSLGASLGTMFAFAAAAKSGAYVPSPVTCINIASPMVGNIGFCAAFRHLEETGRLRQLRIMSQEDAIPRGPIRLLIGWPSNIYHHVGMEFKCLKKPPHYVISFKEVPTNLFMICVYGVMSSLQRLVYVVWLTFIGCCKVPKYHSCRRYCERIIDRRHFLNKLTLDELYHRAIVKGERGILERRGHSY